ncbi:MAG: hypothetical protein FWG40_00620 [Peptococcaceae bacterium]|nr:hypothetical protein [Peptococcaceae bacterium]
MEELERGIEALSDVLVRIANKENMGTFVSMGEVVAVTGDKVSVFVEGAAIDMFRACSPSVGERVVILNNGSIKVAIAVIGGGSDFGKAHLPIYANPEPITDALMSVAESYFNNRTSLVYAQSTIFDSLPIPNAIDCSTFTRLVMRGIAYQDSKYVNPSNSNLGSVPWALNDFPRTAAAQARHCAKHGWLLSNDAEKRPGDLVFWARDPGRTSDRYMQISHVAVVANPPAATHTEWLFGTINLETGSFVTNTERARTGYIAVQPGQHLFLKLPDPEWCWMSIALHKTQAINSEYLGTTNMVYGNSVQNRTGTVKIWIPAECNYIRCYIAHRVDGAYLPVSQGDLDTMTMQYWNAGLDETYEATSSSLTILRRPIMANQPEKIVMWARPYFEGGS